jgi:hypothetical protein
MFFKKFRIPPEVKKALPWTPGHNKAKRAGGLDSIRLEAFIKICKLVSVSMVPVSFLCLAQKKKIKRWLTHSQIE